MTGKPVSFAGAGIAALVLILSGWGCGGGGGGGGGTVVATPTAPLPPAGPAPSEGEAGDQTLFGQAEGMFDPSASFAGARIRVVGVVSDTIRTDNSFFLDPVPPGLHVLAVNGPGFLDRKLDFQMRAGGANEIAPLHLVQSGSFNLDAFDEIYRSDGERGTARFVEPPEFVIDSTSFGKLSGGNGARLETQVEMATLGPIRQAVRPFLNGVEISSRSLQQNWESPCDLPQGKVYWYAERELRDENGQRLLGNAWWCWYPTLDQIIGGILTLDASAGTGTILHELVHILGTADHLEKTPGSSIIRAPRLISALSAMDERHLAFLYSRPPGLMTPDDASGLGLSGSTSLGAGSGTEVRCTIYPGGRVVLERGPAGSFAPRR